VLVPPKPLSGLRVSLYGLVCHAVVTMLYLFENVTGGLNWIALFLVSKKNLVGLAIHVHLQ
jgi:hypothetical protein